MNEHRVYRTLVVPSVGGRVNFYRKIILPLYKKCDKALFMGNMFGFGKQYQTVLYGKSIPNRYVPSSIIGICRTDWFSNLVLGPRDIIVLHDPLKYTTREAMVTLTDYFQWNSLDIATMDKGRLVTFGGLTHGMWLEIGKPDTAYEAMNRLNEKFRGQLQLGPSFQTGHRPNFAANPVFADPFKEFYPSWLTSMDEMPFGQVVGSRSLNSNRGKELLQDPDNPLYWVDKVSFRTFGSVASINGQTVISVGLRQKYGVHETLDRDESILVEVSPTDHVSDKYITREERRHKKEQQKLITDV